MEPEYKNYKDVNNMQLLFINNNACKYKNSARIFAKNISES